MMGALEAWHPLPAWAVPMPRSVFAVVMAALAAMLFWIGAEYVQVESAVRQLRFVLQGIGVDKVPDAPLPDVRLLDEPRELHRFLLAQPRPGMTPDELEWMRRVSMREPRAIPMLRYALATGLNGRPQEAELTLRRFCKMHLARSCDEGRDSWRAVQDHYAPSCDRFPIRTPQRNCRSSVIRRRFLTESRSGAREVALDRRLVGSPPFPLRCGYSAACARP